MEQVLVYKKEKIKHKDILWVVLIAVFCMNFMNVGLYVPLLISPVIFLIMLQEKLSYRFIATFTVLLITFLTYSSLTLMYGFIEVGTAIRYILIPITMLSLGYHLVRNDVNFKKTYLYLFTLIISFTLYGFFDYLKTINVYGTLDAAMLVFGGRVLLNVWDGTPVSATAINMTLSLGLSLLSLIFISSREMPTKMVTKGLLIFSFLVSAFITIQLGNRTSLVIIIVCLLVSVLFSRKLSMKKIKNFILTAIVFSIGSTLYFLNFLGLKTIGENSLLLTRFTQMNLTDDPRKDGWITAFFGLFEYPLGGRETIIPGLKYAHNMWLDMGTDAGFLSFFLMIFFSLLTLAAIVKFVRSCQSILMKSLVIALYTAFNLTFFIEPVIQGSFTYFIIFCFFIGMILRLNAEYKSQ